MKRSVTVGRIAAGFTVLLACGQWCMVAGAQGAREVSARAPSRITDGKQKMLTAGAVASDVLAIGPYAFEGLEAADIEGLRATGVGRFCDPSIGFPCLLEAPVELPDGVRVTRLELDAVDAGASFVKANFYRCPVASEGCDLLAEVSTTGSPGATQVGADLATPETITNTSYTYLLEIFPGDDTLTRLLGARLIFSGPESTALSDVLALHPYAFEGRSPSDRVALRADGIQRYCTGTSCTLVAPVELPSGVTVTRIELDAVDSGAASVDAVLSRCGVASGSCESIGSVSSDSQPGLDLAAPETIDNEDFTYVVDVSLGATIDTRLVGLRLFFDRPAALPRQDRLSISPFAFEGHEAADSLVLDVLGDARFCNGQSCTLLAPVELPSGTQVDRLELSGWDSSSAELRATLRRCPVGAGTCQEAATIATVDTPGATVVGVDIGTPEVIDNDGFTYMVEVQGGPNADTTLRSVSLVIERSLIFSDGFGSGDTTPWSNTVP